MPPPSSSAQTIPPSVIRDPDRLMFPVYRRGRRFAAMRHTRSTYAIALCALLSGSAAAQPVASATLDSVGARIDPFVARSRLLVLTDIANEPDDQMSLVRLLVYSNQIEIEGLVASTS